MSDFGLLFPGQGAQRVGMGAELYEQSAAARSVFERANEILDTDIARLCFEGPEDELQRTDISQPAILVTSLAVFEALKEAGKFDESGCKATAGLSLGEYTSLAAAGAMSYDDAIRIVNYRGQFMQEACELEPSGMASIIGMDLTELEAVIQVASSAGEICLANFNSPAQVAIAGAEKALEIACETARTKGVKVFPLKVAGAFHSRLMSPAAKRLESHLREIELSEPKFPVIANVTGEVVTQPEEIRTCLIQQVDHPVKWVDCVQKALGMGLSMFYEVGPGKVLAGLMRKIDRSASVESIGTSEDIAKV